jgi:hypothetical protein
MKMLNPDAQEACFGFSAPDDRVFSLNIPAMNGDGQEHSRYSFDIEFDPEAPDKMVVRLLELDEHNFIRAVHTSRSFPVGMLSELLSQRKATAEEIAGWQAAAEDE